jgi:hypothetical protein
MNKKIYIKILHEHDQKYLTSFIIKMNLVKKIQ